MPEAGTRAAIHPDTRLGAVYLTVTNLERSLDFYRRVIGFKLQRREGDTVTLGAGGAELLVLSERPRARRVSGTAGLYHFALLVPSRRELARALGRIAETQTAVQGLVDHWISEAIYLPDPDGHGIEIACDRPREQWPPFQAIARRGNLPLDVQGLIGELRGAPLRTELHADTAVGHVHLHVADLQQAEAFYHEVLGFEKLAYGIPTAGFVSAGGYHHHIGYNTWAGVGAPSPPVDAVGLQWFTVELPTPAALQRVIDRIHAAGLTLEEREEGVLVRDPSGNGVLLQAGAS